MIIGIKVNGLLVCERVEDCARHLIYRSLEIPPQEGWHLEKRFLHSLLRQLPAIAMDVFPGYRHTWQGFIANVEATKHYLPKLVYTHKHAERVFLRKVPYWHDVATCVEYMLGNRICTSNIIYFQVSPFINGANKYLPNHKSFRVDLESDKAVIDLKPGNPFPLSFIEHISGITDPDFILPSVARYWDTSMGSPCTVCPYSSLCYVVDRDGLRLAQIKNREFQI